MYALNYGRVWLKNCYEILNLQSRKFTDSTEKNWNQAEVNKDSYSKAGRGLNEIIGKVSTNVAM